MRGNKGFSLVELIIVISIMAVLLGVLAPQYIQYVGRAKRSVDIQNAETIARGYKISMIGNPETTFSSDTVTFIPNCNAVGWTKDTLDAYRTTATNDSVLYYMAENWDSIPDPRSVKGGSWYFTYNNINNLPEKLFIVSSDGSTFYEVWPNSDEYYKTGKGKSPAQIQASY